MQLWSISHRILFESIILITIFISFLASSKLYHLLITFVNTLDPDQDRQNVGPDLDPNCLTKAHKIAQHPNQKFLQLHVAVSLFK